VDLLTEKKFNLETENETENETEKLRVFERKDQRHLNTFTIDPITCRDCDDAFSIEQSENVYF
jgi:exoribonuclease R